MINAQHRPIDVHPIIFHSLANRNAHKVCNHLIHRVYPLFARPASGTGRGHHLLAQLERIRIVVKLQVEEEVGIAVCWFVVMRRNGGHSRSCFEDRRHIVVLFFVVSIVEVEIVIERRGRGWGFVAGWGWWGVGVRIQEFVVTAFF